MTIGSSPEFKPGLENSLPKLEEINLDLPELEVGEYKKTKDHKYLATFNSFPVEIDLHNESYRNPRDNSLEARMRINVFLKGQQNLSATLGLVVSEGIRFFHATTGIRNFDSFPEIPTERKLKGLGRALWQMSLDLIQQFANRLSAEVEHEVTKGPSMGLSKEKWDELFVPLLGQRGYVPADKYEIHWVKKYFPEK